MKKVEFEQAGKDNAGRVIVDVYVDGELFGTLSHENNFEWNLTQYHEGQRGLVDEVVAYYDDLKETENEIKFEIENY
ncbi:hypothetical protein [Limosilactobacillus oris]|uniref:hypothetical protein n=1 Tax=Limosilactobacillus oris TaxID=1632 RepID=UPI00320961CD